MCLLFLSVVFFTSFLPLLRLLSNPTTRAGESLLRLCELRLHLQHGLVYLHDAADTGPLLASLATTCSAAVSRHAESLSEALWAEPAALTRAVRLIIPRAAEELEWTRVDPSSDRACFEAVWSPTPQQRRLVSINVLAGVVLLDGFPPCRVPASARADANYVRVFETRDFEVPV